MGAGMGIAMMGLIGLVGVANYACGLFRFGGPLESVAWRYASTIVDGLALTAVVVICWRTRA